MDIFWLIQITDLNNFENIFTAVAMIPVNCISTKIRAQLIFSQNWPIGMYIIIIYDHIEKKKKKMCFKEHNVEKDTEMVFLGIVARNLHTG